MNICLITLEWPPYGYGIGTYMFNLARGLHSYGHNVTVITSDTKPLPCPGIKLIHVPPPAGNKSIFRRIKKWRMEPYHTWSLRVYRKFKALYNSKSFDIIETAEFGAWARHFVSDSNTPLVVRCHNPTHVVWSINQTPKNSWAMPLWLRLQDKQERRQTFNADAIVSPSYALANHLSLSWVIPRSRFVVLPNPIDAELFCTPHSTSQRKTEILYVGRLQLNKGSFDLAEAIVPLLSKYPELSLRIVGPDAKSPKQFNRPGKMASDVIRLLIPPQYHNRLLFTNHLPLQDIVPFFQQAICAVMPTRGFESFSYTVLEPMACGCPVIATHCGGPSEIITDSVDGLLVPPGNTHALTFALETLIKNPRTSQKLASEARRTVEQRFAIPVVIPQITRFYEDVIRNYKKRRSRVSD